MNKKQIYKGLSLIAFIAIVYGLINSLDSIAQSIIDFINSAGAAFAVLAIVLLLVALLSKKH